MHEKRSQNHNGQRKTRVTLGATSSPVGIVFAWAIYHQLGWKMSEFELIAFSSVIGSVTSAMAICFWDLRGLLLNRIYKRRKDDYED